MRCCLVSLQVGAKQKNYFKQLLEPYRVCMDEAIRAYLGRWPEGLPLREPCEHALLGAAKRFRPALVLMVAKAVNRGLDATESALAVEFFHTASLIADDLPSMDNDDTRRSQPSLHKRYGEATALLVTYALIAEGYSCLSQNARTLQGLGVTQERADRICVLALDNVCVNTGLFGATGGQWLDLFPPDCTLETIREVFRRKTVALFEISFVLGWLYGGGEEEKLALVKEASNHFGMAFQIADDLMDEDQDRANGNKVNICLAVGREAALATLKEEVLKYGEAIRKLGLGASELASLTELIVV